MRNMFVDPKLWTPQSDNKLMRVTMHKKAHAKAIILTKLLKFMETVVTRH